MGTENENEAGPNELEESVPSDSGGDESAEHWDEGALVLGCLAKDPAAQTTLVLGYAEYWQN